MAKKGRSNRGLAKIEPAARKMFFSVPFNDAANGRIAYIDLSQCASIVNRRFYRQGLNWAVAGFKLHTAATTTGTVNLYKIQDTWSASNSWVKSKALWNQMNDLVLDDQPSIKPKFHDFKISMDTEHVGQISGVFWTNLIPYNEDSAGAQTPYLQGEWTRSLLELPNYGGVPGATQSKALRMHGAADVGVSVGMLQGYADSRSVPTEPDPVTQADADTGWMNKLLDEGDSHDDIALNLQTIGEDLPYNQLLYPGGVTNAPDPEIHSLSIITNTTVGGQTSVMGGNFQCGLIKIVNNLTDGAVEPATAFDLELILVPGPHRGYLCEPMQDV
ncbi:hypothetical protein N9939_01900 [bacterium]|nr:hypothetical protein [bacterium]